MPFTHQVKPFALQGWSKRIGPFHRCVNNGSVEFLAMLHEQSVNFAAADDVHVLFVLDITTLRRLGSGWPRLSQVFRPMTTVRCRVVRLKC
jgi:hypothetical protein